MTTPNARQEAAIIAADHLVGNLWFNLGALPLLAGRLQTDAMPDSPASVVYECMVDVFRQGGAKLSAASIEAALKRKAFDFRWLEDVQRRILPEDTETLVGYVAAINDAANLRRADAIAGQVQTAARKGDLPAETVIADALRNLTAIGQTVEGPQPLAALASELDGMLDKWQRGEVADGLPTGFSDLDKIISLRPGELIVLAGRPSMGKSALAFQLGLNVARRLREQGDTGQVAIFSAEMEGQALALRLACVEAGVNAHRLRRRLAATTEWERVHRATEALRLLPIVVDDSAGPTASQVFYRSAMLDAQRPVRLVIFDYLEMFGDLDQRNMTQSVGMAAKAMKNLAKRLNCPVVLLSQLSRAVEERADKLPMLADLRNSGDIEAAADIALFLMRPEYYVKRNDGRPYMIDPSHAAGVAYAIVAKQRNGPIGAIPMAFSEDTARFANLSSNGHRP